MNDTLFIKTFGGFSITYQDRVITDQDNRSKKLWVLLEYIIAYHERSIPRSTLIDMLWTEDSVSSDPENALKTSLHRVRGLLSDLGVEEKKIILHKQGTYSWNPSLRCRFDFEDFVFYYRKASIRELDIVERIHCYREAFTLYRGNFLPKCVTEDWGANLATHYHTIYSKMMHDFMSLLVSLERYTDIISYCGQAAALDPQDEDINYFLIFSLYKSGLQTSAIDHYNKIVSMYYDEFGVDPPTRFLELYNEITTHQESVKADLNTIQQDLVEKSAERSAYFCDYSIFKHFYKIEARSCARTGVSVFLILFTVNDKQGQPDDSVIISKGMSRLKTVIGSSLRSSDAYARYSANQYIAMLPTACYEDSLMIGKRILTNFDRSRPRINADVSYAVKYLEPQLFNTPD